MDIQDLYGIFLRCGRVSTDSRSIGGGELFFAVRGERFDGNLYADAALKAGAAYAVVDSDSDAAKSSDTRIIPVDGTVETLKSLARCHRRAACGGKLPVIGLTGTNGKTTTKELIRAVLSKKYEVTATEGNLNNEIGVPLSVLKISPKTQIAVIEMGANHPEDITSLVNVCEPDYGLITNVGRAHLLGFGSFDGVKMAKGRLYDFLCAHGGRAFINAGDPVLCSMAEERGLKSLIPYGIEPDRVEILDSLPDRPFLRMRIGDRVLETSLAGAYNAVNVLAALAVGRHFGVGEDDAFEAIASYIPKNNRSQFVDTGKNFLVVDAYNANPSSMEAALGSFARLCGKSKYAMLGDMRELGSDSLAEHIKVIEKLRGMPLDGVFLVGEEFSKALAEAPLEGALWFGTSEQLAGYMAEHPLAGASVLVKGSRGIEMEKALPLL